MARDRKRVRTVTVLLHPVMSAWTARPRPVSMGPVPTWLRTSVARRLLVVVAVAAGGWLLGGAGHAHAGSLPRPGAPGVMSGAGPRALPATDSATVPTAVPDAISHGRGAGRLVHDLRGAGQAVPLRSSTVLGAPARVRRAVSDFASIGSWTAGRLPGLPWTPRLRVRAGAGTGERTGGRVPVRIAATGASKDGRAAAGTEVTLPAAWPDPGSQPAPVRRGGALLATAGSALAGGAVACLTRARPGVHAPVVPASWSGFGAPAVRTSGDEPAFSPD